MKILDYRQLTDLGPAKVQFIRIDPEDISATLADILKALMDISWLKNFDEEYERSAFASRANKTIKDIKEKFSKCSDDKVTSSAGEYIVSESARKALINQLSYLDIPLAELLGKKKSGNPGFDFHSANLITDTVIFGEDKYVATTSAYSTALPQIQRFIQNKKDVEDLPDLKPFCSPNALNRAYKGQKGFAAAFSARNVSSDKLINKIKSRSDFKSLLCYEEIILVAVNI